MIQHVTVAAIALLSVLSSCILGLTAYGRFQRGAKRLWEREQRLPDATRYYHLQNLVGDLQREVDDLREAKWDAEQVIEEATRQREWMEQTKEEVKQIESDREEALETQKELESRQSELADCKQQLVDTNATLADLNKRIEAAQEVERQLKQQQEENERQIKLQQEASESLRAEAVQAKEDLDATKDALEKSSRDLKSIEDQLQQLRSSVNEADRKRTELKHENAARKKQRDRQQEECQSLQGDLHELKGKIDGLKGQRASLDNLVSKLSSVSGVDDDAKIESANASLWDPCLTRIAPTVEVDELEQLTELRDYLNSKRLQYDQRTLDAFHTSLKVSDSSPLVVLAGVSGTGKSVLPQCYAQALDMSFLNIAVQPRWDGPQDLFGFFDYIDRRFRPTSLTRALLQMDRFGKENGRGWHPPKGWHEKNHIPDKMLLVLLDEMNLARVEYYFSEFLSRLETRRTIADVSVASDRAGSEIELDVGGKQEGALRLFVGSNVLFVGTMNEDETTQSLSDKVIDRANILRFGSPASLQVDLSGENGKPIDRPPRGFSWKNWQSWQRKPQDIDGRDQATISGRIESLRSALDGVHRPFAYRVANGIWDYVANYPRRTHWLDHAMSDQIEQKILPKLRGLDPVDSAVREAFDGVRNVLNDLNDKPLLDAFDECCEDQFFTWRGIDRR